MTNEITAIDSEIEDLNNYISVQTYSIAILQKTLNGIQENVAGVKSKISELQKQREKIIKENEDVVGDKFSLEGTAYYEFILCYQKGLYSLIITKKVENGISCPNSLGRTWGGTHDNIVSAFGVQGRSKFKRLPRE